MDKETEFLTSLDEGRLVEAKDWMPDAYRRELIRLISIHGVSELMGALPEKEWIPRAPTLQRRLALMAKVQDEMGHAQLLLRLVEDLLAPVGRTREDILQDLFESRQKFHNVFHLEVPTWADVGIIAWLVDGAAVITQGMLLKGSYGPYRRVLRRIVEEESFHLQHGESVCMALAEGNQRQRAELNAALQRWWPALMMFFGPKDSAQGSRHQAINLRYRLRTESNESLRQRFLTKYVPRIRALGLVIPDPQLQKSAEGPWTYEEPDWVRFHEIINNRGPKSAARIRLKSTTYAEGRWIRQALAHTVI